MDDFTRGIHDIVVKKTLEATKHLRDELATVEAENKRLRDALEEIVNTWGYDDEEITDPDWVLVARTALEAK